MYVAVKELTPVIQTALKSVRYGSRDIEIEAAGDSVALNAYAGQGQRAFMIAVNLDTGESKSLVGDWGGSNMFTRNPVDNNGGKITLPPNGAVITGTMGYPRTFARIRTNALGRFLPSGEPDTTTDEEQQAIYCFTGIKGGEYRREELARRKVSQGTIETLIERGFLKRNKAGSVQITTAGKNARDRSRVRG